MYFVTHTKNLSKKIKYETVHHDFCFWGLSAPTNQPENRWKKKTIKMQAKTRARVQTLLTMIIRQEGRPRVGKRARSAGLALKKQKEPLGQAGPNQI